MVVGERFEIQRYMDGSSKFLLVVSTLMIQGSLKTYRVIIYDTKRTKVIENPILATSLMDQLVQLTYCSFIAFRNILHFECPHDIDIRRPYLRYVKVIAFLP